MRAVRKLILQALILLVVVVPIVSSAESNIESIFKNDACEFSDASNCLDFDPSENTGSQIETSSYRLTFISQGKDPLSIAFNVVNVALTFLGAISLTFILYAGWLWFSSGENEEKITQAKNIIKGAVIGLVLTIGSFGIAQFLFNLTKTITA